MNLFKRWLAKLSRTVLEIPPSRLTYCYIVARDGGDGALFHGVDHVGVFANLDHYAIVPVEQYRAVCEMAGGMQQELERLPVRP